MDTTQAHVPNPALEATVARPPGAPVPGGPPEPPRPAAFVGGSNAATVGAHDLAPLLRKRLLFLSLLFAAFYGTLIPVWLWYLSTKDWGPDAWAPVASAPLFLLLAAWLWRNPGLTVRQLRGAEIALFTVLVVRLLLRGYSLLWQRPTVDEAMGLHAAGQITLSEDVLTSLVFRLTTLSTVFLVAYGVIVPNTWRRCAIVVAAFAALPVVIWVVGFAARGVPAERWFPIGVVVAFMMLFQAAVLAVYGAYRIESARQEVAEARRLGQYVLREKLGGGGMGDVYLADHVLLRRSCAVKLIRPERAGDPGTLARFEREVQATAALTHPNTVQVFDYGHTPDGTFYYVMEHLPGVTLAELVSADGPLPPARAVHLLRQLCGALAEAHAAGLTHRDIKPGNVIVCERGGVPDVAKLLDFGLVQTAADADDKLTHVGAVVGTPSYMAPEQISGEPADARTDIYALGALGYFLLTGRPPFAGKTVAQLLAAHLHERPEPPRAHRPDLPPALEAVVLRCLAKRPAERFATVQELGAALAAALGEERRV
jgi:serine/threonine-protein kinase